MSDAVKPNESSSANDDELDELLDSALEDFDRPLSRDASSHSQVDNSTPASSGTSALSASPNTPVQQPETAASSSQNANQSQDELFNELFNASMPAEAQQQMEEMMKALMGSAGPDVSQFEQFAQSAASAMGGSEAAPEFSATLEQTLGSLAENAEKLQSELPEDDLMRMMSGMGLGGGGDGGELDFMPMMQQMMQNLLSKDVLYPSLKEITQKYPDWLTENKGKIAESEYDRYTKQNSLMNQIVEEFEQEKETDSDAVKKTRFDKLLDVMQEMQELGQPPKDIVGELPPGMNLDESGMPAFPGAPDQCSVM